MERDNNSSMTGGVTVKKTCFVICPIGDEGSPTREKSDFVFDNIIKPVLEEENYNVLRSDHINSPGIISTQIMEYLDGSDLIIADLREKNPNVFYELGICHGIEKPTITLCEFGEELPFDLSHYRTIFYLIDDSQVESYKSKLREFHDNLMKNPEDNKNPFTQYRSNKQLIIEEIKKNQNTEAIKKIVSSLLLMTANDKVSSASQAVNDTHSSLKDRLEWVQYEIFNLTIKRNELFRASEQVLTKKGYRVIENDIKQIDEKIQSLKEEESALKHFLESMKSK